MSVSERIDSNRNGVTLRIHTPNSHLSSLPLDKTKAAYRHEAKEHARHTTHVDG